MAIDYFEIDKRPIILYDGICNLCNKGINKIMQRDTAGFYRFAALQSKPWQQLLIRCGRATDVITSVVLVEEDRHFTKTDAIYHIYRRLPMPGPVLAAVVGVWPRAIRDALYDQVAKNRYNIFGRSEACRCDAGVDGFADRFWELRA